MASKADLVAQVKQIQRTDESAKQQWWAFCDEQLGGIKDPNRHEADVLEQFLVSMGASMDFGGSSKPKKRSAPAPEMGKGGSWEYGYGKGGFDMFGAASFGFQPPALQAGYGGGFGGGGAPTPTGRVSPGAGDGSLADMIKLGQKRSQHWKMAWQTYCAQLGNGFNDPSRHEEQFLVDFLDYVGQLVIQDMGMAGVPTGAVYAAEPPVGSGGKRPMGGAGGFPPAKRQAVGGGHEHRRGGHNSALDVDKDELVARVKALQRSSADAKSAWWSFCGQYQGGIKDPNRHDADALLKFLQTWE
uniref:Uncharacterized protein n=1 Tax=Alexandrium andersonii TaxID=327968 RepID=A0A7S2NKF0_9DINO|mmetsp:Transcript_98423/g.220568  ORF Transcript_98423/g.220568 Transcript_98423/m.220568 type:complete len:300 (+) Transcript_98423:80-979(+)